MVEPHNSNEYYADTFLDLQKDLANYLGESHDIDGEWTIEEKRRFINKGLVHVAAMTLTTPRSVDWDITGTSANPARTTIPPDRMIKPIRLFIEGYEYLQLDLDGFLDRLGSSINGAPTSSTSVVNLQQHTNRFFYWNEGTNNFDLNPPIVGTENAVLYMMAMPKKLEKDGEVPDISPIFSYLASVWAAIHMLDKDEEHRDRGEVARRRWLSGLKAFERYKHRGVGNKSTTMKKDPNKFSRGSSIDGMDLKTTFDRLP